MKTPKELSKIYNRLPKDKTELAKVELGIVDDIESAITNLKKQKDILDDAERKQFDAVVVIRKAIAAAQKIDDKNKSTVNKSVSLADKSAKLITKAKQAAKDLGVKDSDIKGLKELFSVIDDIDQIAEQIKDFKYTYDKVK
tara:strand:- start:45 stop:467 length:423 start_codon:yes stop_codon:yes gene_type:complete